MHDLPGWFRPRGSTRPDSARARSFTRLTICAPSRRSPARFRSGITGPVRREHRTSTPKSLSFFSIRREVNSSVSGLITSRSAGGSSSSASAGAPYRQILEERRLLLLDDALRLRDLAHRGLVRIGSWCSMIRLRSSSTAASRSTVAITPALRPRAVARARPPSARRTRARLRAAPWRSAKKSR